MGLKEAVARSIGVVGGGRWMLSQVGAAAIVLMLAALLVAQSPLVGAQPDGPVVGAVVRVATTDGEPLNLRAGTSSEQPVIARLPDGELLTVTGPARTEAGVSWLPVSTTGGTTGWVSAQYVVVVSTPTPIPSPTADPTVAALASPEPPEIATPVPTVAEASPTPDTQQAGRPVEVEAKVKYPEARGMKQEISVWITRDGAPIVGATVTFVSKSGDDDEPIRELEPTDVEGRTRREFDIRHEKGAIELHVAAIAPDGGTGSTVVTYFRR